MKTQTIYQVEEKDFQQAIEKAMQSHVSDVAFARFEGRKVSSQVACEILNVNRRTLYRYIGSGLITTEEREGSEEHKFDLRMLLEFNIKHRKQQWKNSASS